jgi:hypothetical protein
MYLYHSLEIRWDLFFEMFLEEFASVGESFFPSFSKKG